MEQNLEPWLNVAQHIYDNKPLPSVDFEALLDVVVLGPHPEVADTILTTLFKVRSNDTSLSWVYAYCVDLFIYFYVG